MATQSKRSKSKTQAKRATTEAKKSAAASAEREQARGDQDRRGREEPGADRRRDRRRPARSASSSRVGDRISDLVEPWTDRSTAEKQIKTYRTQLRKTLKRTERRGTSARRKATTEARKTRTRVEREARKHQRTVETHPEAQPQRGRAPRPPRDRRAEHPRPEPGRPDLLSSLGTRQSPQHRPPRETGAVFVWVRGGELGSFEDGVLLRLRSEDRPAPAALNLQAAEIALELLAWDKARVAGFLGLAPDADLELLIETRGRVSIGACSMPCTARPLPTRPRKGKRWLQEPAGRARGPSVHDREPGGLLKPPKLRADRRRP